ncbi:MAG: NUDIX domain-containing protein [Treponema sp.]|jgi:8-oxo-dGTP pyrophosphatase MutT (NUDIX family)|nr:NUDIX domain-containing protein [Treponema sp.]
MFKFCPACASEKIRFEKNVFRCPDCGLVYYHNTAAATGCLIVVPECAYSSGACSSGADSGGAERFLLLVRGKEPSRGKLDLPGGFVDPGEGALEGLYRELKEELGWAPPIPEGVPLTSVFTLFASFSNVYPYKNFSYNTCDLYFHLRAPGLCEQNLRLEKAEIAGVRFLKPEEINYDEVAFESTRRALRTYINSLSH